MEIKDKLKEFFFKKELIISSLVIVGVYSLIGHPMIEGTFIPLDNLLMLIPISYFSCLFLSGTAETFMSIGDKS